MEKELLRNFLYEVQESGTASVSKRRLLRWMGRSNDTPTVWRMLLDEWEEVDGDRDALQGFETDQGQLTLFLGKAQPVTDWT